MQSFSLPYADSESTGKTGGNNQLAVWGQWGMGATSSRGGENMQWLARAQPYYKGGGQAQTLRPASAKDADHQACKSMVMRQVQDQAGKSICRSGSDVVIAGQVHGRDQRHRTKSVGGGGTIKAC